MDICLGLFLTHSVSMLWVPERTSKLVQTPQILRLHTVQSASLILFQLLDHSSSSLSACIWLHLPQARRSFHVLSHCNIRVFQVGSIFLLLDLSSLFPPLPGDHSWVFSVCLSLVSSSIIFHQFFFFLQGSAITFLRTVQ